MDKENLRIVIIGSGNVATQLGRILKKNGYNIKQVISKNLSHAQKLATVLNSSFTNRINELDKEAEVYIFAVNDSSLKDISLKLNLNHAVAIHTSGFLDLNVLKKVSDRHAVIYPLQSLTQDHKIDFFNEVPLFIEASDKQVLNTVKSLASSISKNVSEIDSDLRKVLHLAAVFVNNFGNHLLNVSEQLCRQNNIDFKLLQPLAKETVNKAFTNNPSDVQTGPAIRKDIDIIDKQIKWLKENFPEYIEVYEVITDSILKRKKV